MNFMQHFLQCSECNAMAKIRQMVPRGADTEARELSWKMSSKNIKTDGKDTFLKQVS